MDLFYLYAATSITLGAGMGGFPYLIWPLSERADRCTTLIGLITTGVGLSCALDFEGSGGTDLMQGLLVSGLLSLVIGILLVQGCARALRARLGDRFLSCFHQAL